MIGFDKLLSNVLKIYNKRKYKKEIIEQIFFYKTRVQIFVMIACLSQVFRVSLEINLSKEKIFFRRII